MSNIDNTKDMSPEQIKNILTNLINKNAKKIASEGNYDRTILAKIQYCSDGTLGQYKIQYQNGYYTAYALDKTVKYNDGAMVYVTVPGNDLSNRLFIQDLATNNSSQKTYLTNLEGDQQYAVTGPNFISRVNNSNGLNLSSHWDMPEGREVIYYQYGKTNNKLNIRDLGTITNSLKSGDGFIRFGAEFRTNLTDDRKAQPGNYGIRLVLVFDKIDPVTKKRTEAKETYELDTFHMDGAPFEFTEYSPRYEYWEIDKNNFKRIESISGFVKGFDESDIEPIDIYIRNISINSARKMYEAVANDDYVVTVLAEKGTLLNGAEAYHELPFEAVFTVRGNEVKNDNNIQYYWAKKNDAVNSVGHSKYLKYFGKGWQCLNTYNISKKNKDDLTDEDLKDFVVESEDYPAGYVGLKEWNSAKSIKLSERLCKGRETILKCCVLYENNIYSSREYIITNLNGYYVLLDSSNGTDFYNNNGLTTLTAGVFKTTVTGEGDAATYKSPPDRYSVNDTKITYRWSITNNGVVTDISSPSASELFLNQPDWSTTNSSIQDLKDDVTVNDTVVSSYLSQLSSLTGIDKLLLECCLERYTYYSDYYNDYKNSESSTERERSVIAKRRRDSITTKWNNYIKTLYNSSVTTNELGLYILGGSNVTAKYNNISASQLREWYKNGVDPLDAQEDAVVIDTIEHLYGNTSVPQNTLYNFPASKVVQQAKITVTAFITENGMTEALESKDIFINNSEGAGLDYNLEIVNGEQSFIYDAGGKAPKVTIRALSYRLFDKTGTLVYDSDSDDSELVVTQTRPKWKFYKSSTLITTKYSSDLSNNYTVSSDDPDQVILSNRPKFDYNIASTYNINYKERSNIELSISYLGATYNASTHFTFVKQGELDTNGTNMSLDIEDSIYEQYRSDILTNRMYSRFTNLSGNKITYMPNERHLKNLYMYATKIYSDENTLVSGFDEGDFCNLRFAHGVIKDETYPPTNPMYFKVKGSTSTNLYGYWNENGTHELVDSDSKWSAADGKAKDIQDQTRLGRSRTYDRPSFQINAPSTASSINISLVPPTGFSDNTTLYYKPFGVIYTENQKQYNWTANNIVQCDAIREVAEQIDPDTQKPIKRRNYGYYQIPFFYYGYYKKVNGVYENKTPDNLDPARHFVITGGYDQVIYGADGFNPTYNALEPFTLHLFDVNGKDISDTVFNSNKAVVTWQASYGFRQKPVVSSAPAYSTYQAGVNLDKKYCTYDGKTYKCVVPHTPDQYVAITDESTGVVIKEYNVNPTAGNYDFITPYWEEVTTGDLHGQTRNLTPPPSYDAMATDSLFNSWLAVTIVYNTGEEKIEAAALLPINVLCNVYGSDEINNWDGKKTAVEDGYIIGQKVAAGIKNDDNTFTGLIMGRKMITNGTSDQNEVGLFGYGDYYDSNMGRANHGQTLFIDAKTGLAAFGPRGSTQIILNPKIPSKSSRDESWSRLAGWYFSPNYLYKPLWADDNYISGSGEEIINRGNSSYYNTNPPDADGVTIPGSVGLYVPSSEKSGELTANTVFMWASAANISSSSFDDDGSFTALVKLVDSIKFEMQNAEFPFVYPVTNGTQDVNLQLFSICIIQNYTDLRNVYSNNADIITGLDNYISTWTELINTILQIPEQKDVYNIKPRYELVIDDLNAVKDVFNNASFPTVVRNGVAVTPIVTDGVTIENIDEITKWYINSPEANVTAQTALIETLVERLNAYVNRYKDFLNFLFSHSVEEFIHVPYRQRLQQYIDAIRHGISQAGVSQKVISIWDTTKPYIGVYNKDKVTIDNISQLEGYYLRPAVGATQEQRDYLTLINEKFANYNSLHTRYEQWVADFQDDGQAISYLDSNTKKRNANFYLTYGGEMKCNKATIEGKISARSGVIGTGDGALEISSYHYDPQVGKTQFYLLYNSRFQVKGTDSDSDTTPSVYIDGTIMARSGQIGNPNAGTDGSDAHTVFMEYMWYPRYLPDDNSRWGDDDPTGSSYRIPEWDKKQGTIVTYALWNPYFSIIDNPGGAVNKKKDGSTDFSYRAGDTTFIGRVYATGGRIGDWISDQTHNMFRDPYKSIILKPDIYDDGTKSYIRCGNTVFYGTGAVSGACRTVSPDDINTIPSDPVWYIKSNGEAHFTNMNSEYSGKVIKLGGTTIKETEWNLPKGAKVNWGNATLSVGDSGFSFSAGASFAENVNFIQGASFGQEISINNGATFLGSSLHFGGGSTISVGPGSAVLPTTEFKGEINGGGFSIRNVGTLYCDDIRIGSQTLQAYVVAEINRVLQGKSITIAGNTGDTNEHHHYVSLRGTIS